MKNKVVVTCPSGGTVKVDGKYHKAGDELMMDANDIDRLGDGVVKRVVEQKPAVATPKRKPSVKKEQTDE